MGLSRRSFHSGRLLRACGGGSFEIIGNCSLATIYSAAARASRRPLDRRRASLHCARMFQADLLAGKTLVVTGGGSGLGAAMAGALREPGRACRGAGPAEGEAGGDGGGHRGRRRQGQRLFLRRARPGRRARGGGANRPGGRAGQQCRGELPRRLRGPLRQRLQGGGGHRAGRHLPLHQRVRQADDRGRQGRVHRQHRHHLRLDRLRVRGPFRLRQGRRARDDALARGGVGGLRDPRQRHRARTGAAPRARSRG